MEPGAATAARTALRELPTPRKTCRTCQSKLWNRGIRYGSRSSATGRTHVALENGAAVLDSREPIECCPIKPCCNCDPTGHTTPLMACSADSKAKRRETPLQQILKPSTSRGKRPSSWHAIRSCATSKPARAATVIRLIASLLRLNAIFGTKKFQTNSRRNITAWLSITKEKLIRAERRRCAKPNAPGAFLNERRKILCFSISRKCSVDQASLSRCGAIYIR